LILKKLAKDRLFLYVVTMSGTTVNGWEFKLLYDGQCPMCRREVDWLRQRNRAGRLAFEDISQPGFEPGRYGLTQEEVLQVMHGVFPDGRIIMRVAAFREAYRCVGLGWLLAPTNWPGLRSLADWGYARFARHRVAIGKFLGHHDCQDGTCDISTGRRPL
jgi:predicted DCC family thiol-disulfide oxidoreductase YuxK